MNQPQSANERRTIVVSRVLRLSFGTMWWVKEAVWKFAVPPAFEYDLASTRKAHPGISILEEQAETPKISHVPLMHGSSRAQSRECVTITGFDSYDPNRRCFFGHLISPAHMPRVWIGNFAVDEHSFRREWQRMFGTANATLWVNKPQVFANEHKRRATPDECNLLRQLLERLGIFLWPS
jgi:hypothetical protein